MVLSAQGVEPVEIAGDGGPADWPLPGELGLALVDYGTAGLDSVCRRIKEVVNIPLVLLLEDSGRADWEKLDRLDASGYLSDSVRDEEFSARLSAMIRRLGPRGEQR